MTMTPLAEWLQEQYPAKQVIDANGEPLSLWVTCPARLAFPALVEPRKMEGSLQEPKYQATLLFPLGADMAILNRAAFGMASDQFGESRVKAMWASPTFRKPFRPQSEKDYDGFERNADAKFISVSSKFKPKMFDEKRLEIQADDPRIYPGVWVRAQLRCFAYDQAGNRGVSFGLSSLQRLADDEPFSTGGGDAADGLDEAVAVPAHLRQGGPASAPVNGVDTTPPSDYRRAVDDEIPF
jgi:hypothetical protein